MLRRFSTNFAIFSMLLDALSVAASLCLATLLRPALNALSFIEYMASPIRFPALLYLVIPIIYLLILAALDIYDGRKFLRVVDEFGALSLGHLIAMVSSAGVLYFSYRDVSRSLFITFFLFAFLLSLLWRSIARHFFRVKKNQPDSERRLLVVGSGTLAHKVATKLEQMDSPKMQLLGFVDDAKKTAGSVPILGESRQLKELVLQHGASDVVIALPLSSYPSLEEKVRPLDGLAVNLWLAMGVVDLSLYRAEIEDFSGIPMVNLRASAISDTERLMKRIVDVLLASLLLLLCLPLFLLVTFLVLLMDGKPVFFRQRRVGENGRLFEMLKFRTMVRQAEDRGARAMQQENGAVAIKWKDDPRVTRLGRILRRFSLDELPQFINVLRGEMSLVGPRPELPSLVEQYQPWQRKRFAIPPGMTGWWQVNGRSDKPMHLHTEDDLYYLNNYSLFLDFQILLRTIWVVILGKGAY